MDRILEILAKGIQLTLIDLEEIEHLLMSMDSNQRYTLQGGVLEVIEQTVMDPDYLGDIQISHIEGMALAD